jgi:hypothetical protein
VEKKQIGTKLLPGEKENIDSYVTKETKEIAMMEMTHKKL